MQFEAGQIFYYEDLPKPVQLDFQLQYSYFEWDEYYLADFRFKCALLSLENLLEAMDNIFGPNLLDELESDYVLSLTRDIQLNGLINPTIGQEGIHRRLAFINLQKELPHFTILLPEEEN